MTMNNPVTTTDQKLDAALEELKALRKSESELLAKVQKLEKLVECTHSMFVAFSQSYYWTPEWQAKEAQADEEARLGLGKVYDDVEELIRDLKK